MGALQYIETIKKTPAMKKPINRKILSSLWRYNPWKGLSLISNLDPNDVIIVGYPKSGNTWSQVLISGAVYGFSPILTPDSIVQDLVPDVHDQIFYRRYQVPMFFKSHHMPQPNYRRVVYLLRDGRDVMVSYLHHLRATMGNHVTLKDMVESGKGLFPCRWHEHVRAWKSNPYSADMITVRYEDLLNNAAHELERICTFAGVERPRDLIERIANESQFEKMKAREQRSGWANPEWPKDKAFVRKGKSGGWREEFPADCLDTFMQQSGDTLREYGYL
jgi:hypothetical protein